MYHYFCTNIGLYHVVIYSISYHIQVTQMVLGMGVSITYFHRKSYPELNLDTPLFWSFAMYASYSYCLLDFVNSI